MKKRLKISWLLILILILGTSFCFGQTPVNDLCADAIDISDQAWHSGTTQNAWFNCPDVKTGNCKTPQQTVNQCCGISGIEGTVWYKFISPYTGTGATLEFRNTVCTPATYTVFFFTTITTLQGFLIVGNNCGDPATAPIAACFNPPTAADFTTTGFTTSSLQEYYVQIDTKKNTALTCNCDDPASATCHSYCSFEIRVTFPVAAPVTDFTANAKNNFVNIKWLYDWKDLYTNFYLVRKNVFTKDSVVISSMPIGAYTQQNNYFTYNDYSVKNNGTYKYSLYATVDKGDFKLVGSDDVTINFARETSLNIVPNPSADNIKLLLNNTSGNSYLYTICNALGQIVKSGYTEQSINIETSLSIADLAPGLYLVKVLLEDQVLQQNLIKE